MMRKYKPKKTPSIELGEIIGIANSKIDFFSEKQSFYKFGCEASELRSQLMSIAKQCTFFVNEYSGKYTDLAFARGTYNIPQNLFFRIIENKIVFSPSPIVRILQGVDARRLKLCPVCQDVFWAKKLNTTTCGKKDCVESVSGKKYHVENKEEINRKKRKKYYEDNRIDFCPICVRPQLTCECEIPGKQRSKK